MRVHPWITALLLFAICVNVSAQTQSTAKKSTGVIAGRIAVGSKPVSNITVTLIIPTVQGPPIASTLTDQEGQFEFANIAAGQYQVVPHALSYVNKSGLITYQRGVPVTLDEGESMADLDIPLTMGGVITGRVTDAAGRSLIGETIYLLVADEKGRFSPVFLLNSFAARTDDRGIYRVFGLAAGRYIVAVGSDGKSSYRPRGSVHYYRRTYHPEAAEEVKAKVVEVSEGGEVSGIDIVAGRLVKSYSVSGRIMDETTGKPIPNTTVAIGMIGGPEGNQLTEIVGSPSQSDAGGNFRLEGLAPRRYAVITFKSGDAYTDPTAIEIVDKDITGLEIRMKRGAVVTGFVTIEGTDDPAVRSQLSKVPLHPILTSRESSAILIPFVEPVQVNPDGSFRISGLKTGKLTFEIGRGEQIKNLSLQRVERDGVAQADGIVVTTGEQIQNVRVVLGYGTGILRGQIKVENGALPPDAKVYVALHQAGGNIVGPPVMADKRGKFSFEQLVTGEYEASVFTIITTLEGKPIPFKSVKEKVAVMSGSESQVLLRLEVNPPQ